MKNRSGAAILFQTLTDLGALHVFGLPGTQNIQLFEALRRSSLRAITGVHELSCAFMANGYYRASGKPGILTTIPGPGLTYSLAALTEAAHDSAALVYILLKPRAPGRTFDLQSIDQEAVLRPIVKAILRIEHVSQVRPVVRDAYVLSLSGEPGPVVIHCSSEALTEYTEINDTLVPAVPDRGLPAASTLAEIASVFETARHPVLFLGQGAADASALIKDFAERFHVVVVSTRSGRGIFPEDHPLAVSFDISPFGLEKLLALLDYSDLILALGCKFTHNGSFGFKLRITREKLIHVDASSATLGANYPGRYQVRADCTDFLRGLGAQLRPTTAIGWSYPEIEKFRAPPSPMDDATEPAIDGFKKPSARSFFNDLRSVLPADACVVTDSGRHQVLTTRYFRALTPRSLLLPTDFQSMGFGLPAAIGAKLAAFDRPVVALIGDGGFVMSGMELATAVRERIPLTVIVFNDQSLGQIRVQQLASFGESYATSLLTPDLALFAESVGAQYLRLTSDTMRDLQAALTNGKVTLAEVVVGDQLSMKMVRAKGVLRSAARGPLAQQARRLLRR